MSCPSVFFQHGLRLPLQICPQPPRLQHLRPVPEAEHPLPHIRVAGKIPLQQQSVRCFLITVRAVFLNEPVFSLSANSALRRYAASEKWRSKSSSSKGSSLAANGSAPSSKSQSRFSLNRRNASRSRHQPHTYQADHRNTSLYGSMVRWHSPFS